jgi:hypothetical protein
MYSRRFRQFTGVSDIELSLFDRFDGLSASPAVWAVRPGCLGGLQKASGAAKEGLQKASGDAKEGLQKASGDAKEGLQKASGDAKEGL